MTAKRFLQQNDFEEGAEVSRETMRHILEDFDRRIEENRQSKKEVAA